MVALSADALGTVRRMPVRGLACTPPRRGRALTDVLDGGLGADDHERITHGEARIRHRTRGERAFAPCRSATRLTARCDVGRALPRVAPASGLPDAIVLTSSQRSSSSACMTVSKNAVIPERAVRRRCDVRRWRMERRRESRRRGRAWPRRSGHWTAR